MAQRIWSAVEPDGRRGIVGVVKRTYAFGRGTRLELADVQSPVVGEPEIDLEADGSIRTLIDDSDLVAPKPATDVVVRGTARTRSPVAELDVTVAVGRSIRRLRLVGERRVRVGRGGEASFTFDRPLDAFPLLPESAYGGYDEYAHEQLDPQYVPFESGLGEKGPVRMVGLFAYPRNGVGRAYFVDIDRHRAQDALLPIIEDPADPLRAERLFVPSPLHWLDAPIPGQLGWIAHHWYPRLVRYLGPVLAHAPAVRRIREAAFADGADLVEARPHPPGTAHPRALQGASPGMACERLAGDEPVLLQRFLPQVPELRFDLPGEAPVMTLRPPDVKAFSPQPSLQTVRIDLERLEVSLTWCGRVRLAAPATEELLDETELDVKWVRL